MLLDIWNHANLLLMSFSLFFFLFIIVTSLRTNTSQNVPILWCLISACILVFEIPRLFLTTHGFMSVPSWYILVNVGEWVPIVHAWQEIIYTLSFIIQRRIKSMN